MLRLADPDLAKVFVVGGRRALVGSADLTHRALTSNLEAGILIEDRDLADRHAGAAERV